MHTDRLFPADLNGSHQSLLGQVDRCRQDYLHARQGLTEAHQALQGHHLSSHGYRDFLRDPSKRLLSALSPGKGQALPPIEVLTHMHSQFEEDHAALEGRDERARQLEDIVAARVNALQLQEVTLDSDLEALLAACKASAPFTPGRIGDGEDSLQDHVARTKLITPVFEWTLRDNYFSSLATLRNMRIRVKELRHQHREDYEDRQRRAEQDRHLDTISADFEWQYGVDMSTAEAKLCYAKYMWHVARGACMEAGVVVHVPGIACPSEAKSSSEHSDWYELDQNAERFALGRRDRITSTTITGHMNDVGLTQRGSHEEAIRLEDAHSKVDAWLEDVHGEPAISNHKDGSWNPDEFAGPDDVLLDEKCLTDPEPYRSSNRR